VSVVHGGRTRLDHQSLRQSIRRNRPDCHRRRRLARADRTEASNLPKAHLFTPEDEAFTEDDLPNFTVGAQWTVGALGIPTTIQMHVWDEEEHRLVQLTIPDRQGNQRLLDTFVAAFENADDWEGVSGLTIW
jgi:hypothetical protein